MSTTGTDSDWVVKLVDVYPDDYPLQPDETVADRDRPAHSKMGGYEQLVRGEPFRGKFRKSFEKPEPFAPGQVDKVEFSLPDVFHTFRRGAPDHGAGAEQLVPAREPATPRRS